MTDPKSSAKLRRLVEERGGFIQGNQGKPKPVKRSKKPKKKSLSITNEDTKGVMVCVKNGERVKYWRQDE